MNEPYWLQSLLDVLPQAAVCHEPDGKLGSLNSAAERLFQCRREDVIGRTWTECPWVTFDRDEHQVDELPGRRALASRADLRDTLLGIRAKSHDRLVWVNANSVFVPSERGVSDGSAMVLLEPMVALSQVHPAAAALGWVSQVPPAEMQFRKRADTEVRHRALFEESKCVMLIIHPVTGRILDANQSACDFYGYPRESLVRMKIQDNTLADEAVHSEMARASTLNTGQFRFRHRLASGELRDVEVYSSPIPVEGKRVLHSIVHDVTKRETAKRQIQERNWELRLINSIGNPVEFGVEGRNHAHHPGPLPSPLQAAITWTRARLMARRRPDLSAVRPGRITLEVSYVGLDVIVPQVR